MQKKIKSQRCERKKKNKFLRSIFIIVGIKNPNMLSKDKRKSRLSPPFWQGEKSFSKEKLPNFRFSKTSKKKIRKYNKKPKNKESKYFALLCEWDFNITVGNARRSRCYYILFLEKHQVF